MLVLTSKKLSTGGFAAILMAKPKRVERFGAGFVTRLGAGRHGLNSPVKEKPGRCGPGFPKSAG